MKQSVVISSPTCFGYCVSTIRELHCAWLKLRMSLYVQIVQRQGLAVIFHVVRFSLQEPVVCGLVAGLRVSVTYYNFYCKSNIYATHL
jgi:hypothetical protein